MKPVPFEWLVKVWYKDRDYPMEFIFQDKAAHTIAEVIAHLQLEVTDPDVVGLNIKQVARLV